MKNPIDGAIRGGLIGTGVGGAVITAWTAALLNAQAVGRDYATALIAAGLYAGAAFGGIVGALVGAVRQRGEEPGLQPVRVNVTPDRLK